MNQIIEKIRDKYSISDIIVKKENLAFFTAEKKQALDIVGYLKQMENFSHLVMLTVTDWIEDNKFQLTYILNNPEKKCDIAVRVFIDREKPEMTSAHYLWPHIITDQRELKEMYGIDFPASPGVNDDFVLEG